MKKKILLITIMIAILSLSCVSFGLDLKSNIQTIGDELIEIGSLLLRIGSIVGLMIGLFLSTMSFNSEKVKKNIGLGILICLVAGASSWIAYGFFDLGKAPSTTTPNSFGSTSIYSDIVASERVEMVDYV